MPLNTPIGARLEALVLRRNFANPSSFINKQKMTPFLKDVTFYE